MEESNNNSDKRNIPLKRPNPNPKVQPIIKPISALLKLIEICLYNSPVIKKKKAAFNTSIGAGNIFSGMMPNFDNICHTMINNIGINHGTPLLIIPFIFGYNH